MTQANVWQWTRASVLALSVVVLPIITPVSAQTTTPAPNAPRVERLDETRRDYTGLWGLLGLLGLAGLVGRRRSTVVREYDTPTTPPHTGTEARR